MQNTPIIKRGLLLSLMLSIGISQSANALFKLPSLIPANKKQLARRLLFWGVLVPSFARLAIKEEPSKDRLTRENALAKFKKAKPFSKEWLVLLSKIWDDIFVGFSGKEPGRIKAQGSKVVVTGKETEVTTVNDNGTKLDLIAYKGIDEYGLLGTLMRYLKPTVSMFKDLKDTKETLNYWNVTVDQTP